jgi:predicted nuclease of predicted toxin-antitoxin system
MKIKLDENLSVRLKGALAHLGHDADTVHDERLTGKSDDDVWAAAQADERFFVTLDQDFCDARKYPPGTHAGVLVARLPDSEQYRAAEYVLGWFEQYDPAAWSGCLVIGTPARLRVRRAAPTG